MDFLEDVLFVYMCLTRRSVEHLHLLMYLNRTYLYCQLRVLLWVS